MLTEKINFSNYPKKELIEALENIDDVMYPESAVEIYSLLESKFKTEVESIDDRYNEENGILENILEFIFFPILSEQQPMKAEMLEKLHRIRALVASNDT